MGLSQQLTGTPWHKEYGRMAGNDTRRNKSKCVWYNKETKRCSYLCIKCFGSTHCEKYSTRKRVPDEPSDFTPAVKERSNRPRIKVKSAAEFVNALKPFQAGDRVNLKKYGMGKIVAVNGDLIKVKFKWGEKEIRYFDLVASQRKKKG